MASISLPLPPQTTSAFSPYLDTAGQSPSRHSRRNLTMSSPLPNPPFVFPARDSEPIAQASTTHSGGPPPLPAFSFNPGSAHSSQPSLPSLPINRAGGHRRRCSEFVGGEQLVSPETVEASQNNEENPTMTPTKLPAPGPGFSAGGPGRRRHAHRRSAAISSVDLTAISNTLDLKPAVGSAPLLQTDAKRDLGASDETLRPVCYSATTLGRPTPPASPRIMINDESLPPAHFETIDIVPDGRPISQVSKDSESTIQPEVTARNSSKSGVSTSDLPSTVDRNQKPRPRTADASLMLDPNVFGGSDVSPTKRPLSATGHSRFRKSMSSGIIDAALRKHHAMSDGGHYTDSSRHSSSDDGDSYTSTNDARDSFESSSASKKKSKIKKRQKKVRSWAGAILTRGKGKRHQSKKDETKKSEIPPPVITRTNSDLGSALDVNFDDDEDIVIIRTPTNPTAPQSRQPAAETQQDLENSWKPRSFYEQNTQDDALSPIIDLDAALGPFNTPDARSRRVAESGFSAASRRMYSGGRRGEFVGPEMRYHRRAESAPEMPPLDRSFLNQARLANSSSMENPDVFYEEEEDAFLAATSDLPKGSGEKPPIQAVTSGAEIVDHQSEGSSDTLTREHTSEVDMQQSGLGIQKDGLTQPPEPNIISASQDNGNVVGQQSAISQLQNAKNPFSNRPKSSGPAEIIKQELWQRRLGIPPSPDISPRFLPADNRPCTSPLELTPNIPPFSLQGGGSLSNSSFPSPEFTGSSSDAPRSITTSSTTDRNFSSPSYNPSVDFPHASVEDVPSLTSSASTTTNPLNRISATFFQRSRLSTDRSASFSAAVHRRSSQANSSKRSSLASLSKLVVGPHTERSKLSYEEKPPSDEPERSKKKGHRISRLMQFWRAKDKDKLNESIIHEERPS